MAVVWHIAPGIREMENARLSAGLIIQAVSVGYTVRQAQEGVTQPTPITTPNGGLTNWYFTGSKYTPTL
jgi:hypothetical protein